MKVAFICLLLCFHSALAGHEIFRDVALSFSTKGYQRSDPFELSPTQKEHQRIMQLNNDIAEHKTLPGNIAPAFVEKDQQETPPQPDETKVMEELKIAVAKQNEENNKPGVALTETEAHTQRHKFIDGLASHFAKAKNFFNKMSGKYNPSNSQIYEDCMACRIVWKQVEMDISNPRYVEDVQASFEHNCMDAQKKHYLLQSL